VCIGQANSHRIIAAGDLNILYGHGEHGSEFWASRYSTVFDRLDTLGLRFIGPQSPGGRQAKPWPDELPSVTLSQPIPAWEQRRRPRDSGAARKDR